MGETRYDIIDADQHILEPPHIWKEYLPRKYQEHAPKLVKDHEGGDAWDHGTGAPHPIGLVCTPGQRPHFLEIMEPKLGRPRAQGGTELLLAQELCGHLHA